MPVTGLLHLYMCVCVCFVYILYNHCKPNNSSTLKSYSVNYTGCGGHYIQERIYTLYYSNVVGRQDYVTLSDKMVNG